MVGSFLLDAYFLTIIAGIENTERVAYDFSNVCNFLVLILCNCFCKKN